MQPTTLFRSLLPLCAGALLFTACKKRDRTNPEDCICRQEHLLSKVYRGEKATGPFRIAAEYKYNEFNKPSLLIAYGNGAGDTASVTKFLYDSHGQLQESRLTEGSINGPIAVSQRFFYDSHGRITEVKEDRGSRGLYAFTYAYGNDYVIVTDNYNNRVVYTHDAHGNYLRISSTGPGGNIKTEYSQWDTLPGIYSYTHLERGFYQGAEFYSKNNPGVIVTTGGPAAGTITYAYTYNKDKLVTRRTLQDGGAPVDSFQYILVKTPDSK